MKRFITLLLSVVCAFSCLLAVGCKKEGGEAGTLNIYVLKKGYGTEWADAVKEKFLEQDWVKEKYPDLEVVITIDPNDGTYNTELSKGKASKYDIMFASYAQGSNGDTRLLDLTDVVYNSEVPGETVLYKDKLIEGVAAANSYENEKGTRYGTVSYVNGMYGILYNKTKLDALGFTELPRTTDELIDIMQKVKTKNIPSGVYENTYSIVNTTNGYSYQMFSMWWAQYEGVKEYENFFKGKFKCQTSVEVLKQQGRLESLEVLETLFKRENGYFHPEAAKIDYLTHQQALMKGTGLFHFNGDYFTTEMEMYKETAPDTIGMLPTPVISAIIQHKDCEKIADDAELSALIKAIDASSTELSGDGYEVDQKAFNKVKEARNMVNSATSQSGMIPEWAINKEIAIDFLRFMATDIAYEAVLDATKGLTLPFKYDVKTKNKALYDSLELVHQTKIDVYAGSPVIVKENTAFLLGRNGLYPLTSRIENGKVAFESLFGSAEGAKTAQEVFDEDYNYWTKNNNDAWNTLRAGAGLS